MELLVIVLCLMSERFLVHKCSHHRFDWFVAYGHRIITSLPSLTPWVLLTLIVLPILLLVWLVLQTVGHLFFDFVGVVFNIAIFYYCIGPVNPFYPAHTKPLDEVSDEDIGHYLAQANSELFAILFWYFVLGPVGVLAYRLISLSRGLPAIHSQALVVLNVLDWLPARMTALLYLLVGNFQSGYHYLKNLFFAKPDRNNALISLCGLAALEHHEQKTMLQAEVLVEHATIVFLVFLAFCTILAWV